jgi:hypothetical protein
MCRTVPITKNLIAQKAAAPRNLAQRKPVLFVFAQQPVQENKDSCVGLFLSSFNMEIHLLREVQLRLPVLWVNASSLRKQAKFFSHGNIFISASKTQQMKYFLIVPRECSHR